MQPNNIRDLREAKKLSEDSVAAAAGITYSQFTRIQAGRGKTTPEEVSLVLATIAKMEPGTRKLAGRPFKDSSKQAAVTAAREAGKSVSAALQAIEPAKKPAAKKPEADKKPSDKKPAGKKPATDMAAALKKSRPKPSPAPEPAPKTEEAPQVPTPPVPTPET